MATQNVTRAVEATASAQDASPLTSHREAQLLAMLEKITELADAIQAQADAVINGADDSGLVVGMQALAGQVGWVADSGAMLLGSQGFKVTPTEWMLPRVAVAQG